jgi:hypothetical protein
MPICEHSIFLFGHYLHLFAAALLKKIDSKWKLVWSDDFSYSGLPDSTKWNYDVGGHGWGNNELQFIKATIRNARVEKGYLIIEARKEA